MSDGNDKLGGKPVCNLEYLLVNLGRNRAAARRLIQLFLDNHPHLVERLDTAVHAMDLSALKDVVHDIRSSCVLFSAQMAVDRARDIELALHRQALAEESVDWASKAAALRESLVLVVGELSTYLSEEGF